MDKPHYHGHRQRLRKRFLQQGLVGLQDYEALELLLHFVVRQRDTKPVAKALVDRFGSLKAVLDASAEELQEVGGVGPAAIALIHFVKQAAARYLQQTSRARFSLDSPEALIQYCILSKGAAPNEGLRVICLDADFAIVAEHDLAEGTVDRATVYPRQVMELALQARATTLVLVHNHPSGNVAPSEWDQTLTRAIALAGRALGITVYDHIVVSRDAYYAT